MSDESLPNVSDAIHRRLAVDLFNKTWDWMDDDRRTPDDDAIMLAGAYASLYHWSIVGTPINIARGEWQVSRVYAVLGRAEPCTYHARRCLELCMKHSFGDFDLAYAYEALARAAWLSGDEEAQATFLAEARQAGAAIQEEDDRKIFWNDLNSIPEPQEHA